MGKELDRKVMYFDYQGITYFVVIKIKFVEVSICSRCGEGKVFAFQAKQVSLMYDKKNYRKIESSSAIGEQLLKEINRKLIDDGGRSFLCWKCLDRETDEFFQQESFNDDKEVIMTGDWE